MPASASLAVATEHIASLADGHAQVIAPARSLSLLDARPPTKFTRREEDEALETLANVAGPATAGIVSRVTEAFDAIRAELNERAGGQASAHVMTLAHNAQRAQLAVELQTTVSVAAHGRYVASETGDKGQTEKGLSRLVGICAFATDLLNKAYEAAKAESSSGAAMNPVDRLMGKLGVSRPGYELTQGDVRSGGSVETRVAADPVQARPPVSTGGGGVDWVPPLSNSPPTIESK